MTGVLDKILEGREVVSAGFLSWVPIPDTRYRPMYGRGLASGDGDGQGDGVGRGRGDGVGQIWRIGHGKGRAVGKGAGRGIPGRGR